MQNLRRSLWGAAFEVFVTHRERTHKRNLARSLAQAAKLGMERKKMSTIKGHFSPSLSKNSISTFFPCSLLRYWPTLWKTLKWIYYNWGFFSFSFLNRAKVLLSNNWVMAREEHRQGVKDAASKKILFSTPFFKLKRVPELQWSNPAAIYDFWNYLL